MLRRRLLHHFLHQLDQADFPWFIHADDHGAEGIVLFGERFADLINDHGQGFRDDMVVDFLFPDRKTVFEDHELLFMFAEPFQILGGLGSAEALKRGPGKIVRGDDFRPVGFDAALAHAHFRRVHEFGEEVIVHHRGPKSFEAAFGQNEHMRVVHRIPEIKLPVSAH